MATVTLKFTGNVYREMGTFGMNFTFQGNRARDLLEAFFDQHDLRKLLMNGDGELKPYARLLVNGRFSETIGGLDAPVQDGDTVVLIHPYAVAF